MKAPNAPHDIIAMPRQRKVLPEAVSRRRNSGTFRMPLTVKLKAARETAGEAWSWDRHLTLEFNDLDVWAY